MNQASRPNMPHPDIDPAEWTTLIASRSEDGTVDPNNVAHVFRNVELNAELLRQIESVLDEINISIATVEPDVSGPIERKASSVPRRPSGGSKTAVVEAGDAVRMYLQEIGQVELLTAEGERTLG